MDLLYLFNGNGLFLDLLYLFDGSRLFFDLLKLFHGCRFFFDFRNLFHGSGIFLGNRCIVNGFFCLFDNIFRTFFVRFFRLFDNSAFLDYLFVDLAFFLDNLFRSMFNYFFRFFLYVLLRYHRNSFRIRRARFGRHNIFNDNNYVGILVLSRNFFLHTQHLFLDLEHLSLDFGKQIG